MTPKKYIVSFSGGKDSTAMLHMILERGLDIHSVMWFDTERDFPEIVDHIEQVKKRTGIKFVRLRHWIGFDFLQERFGDAHKSGGWCTAAKRDCCNRYMRLMKKDNPDIIECIGFSVNESKRANGKTIKSKPWPVRYPLIEWNITEEEALQYCYSLGYDFGGIYDWMPSKRVSCYDCPKQSKADWEAIKIHRPELYTKAKT